MNKEMQELTTDRDVITGTVPHQRRLIIRLNREVRLRIPGYYVRPRSIALAVIALAAGIVVMKILKALG